MVQPRKFSLVSFSGVKGKTPGSKNMGGTKHTSFDGDKKGRSMSLPSNFGNKKLLIVIKLVKPANLVRSGKSKNGNRPPRSPPSRKKKTFSSLPQKPSVQNFASHASKQRVSPGLSSRASFLQSDDPITFSSLRRSRVRNVAGYAGDLKVEDKFLGE